ncbi:lymphotoxin-alpha-like [Sebastes umbrosus]|uniref:lymphotoxin-alpha-like n=1 Tax=Sebastes umbrosus TaxID=72105 RepID=UPI00189CE928|nr:lymphotoxin-alpha-like [Sebastes umbrosus]
MLDGSWGLIHEWEIDCMEEEEGCYCGGGGGGETKLHRQDSLVQLLRRKETRLMRISWCLVVVLLLLVSGTMAVLFSVVLGGGRGHQAQPTMQPDSHFSGGRFERLQQQEDLTNPSAMLTAPTGNNSKGGYLVWENAIGFAFCQGGFNYSSGSLVVPRDGIFRVFLQITYESKDDLKCDPDEDEHRLSIGVFLFHDSYPNYMQLLSSVDSVDCGKKRWSKSIYTAGLFSLKANSRLRVKSSKHELIVKTEHQVFFGAELLPK